MPATVHDQKSDNDPDGVWTINREICTLCGRCVQACPESVVALDGGRLILARPEACTYCALCEEVCPTGAIALAYAIVWEEIGIGCVLPAETGG